MSAISRTMVCRMLATPVLPPRRRRRNRPHSLSSGYRLMACRAMARGDKVSADMLHECARVLRRQERSTGGRWCGRERSGS